jgi:hypothetical protein
VEQLSPRELDSIYRATVAMTLERWPGAFGERPKFGRRKLLVLPTLVGIVVAALCLISPEILGVKL